MNAFLNNKNNHDIAGIEGYIDISMSGSSDINIRSHRTTNAAKVFINRSPDQVLEITPLLFSICGIAQTSAAIHAMYAAKQRAFDNNELAVAQRTLVHIETARESLLKLFHNMPMLLNINGSQQQVFTYIGKLVPEFKSALFEDTAPFSLARPDGFEIHRENIHKLSNGLDYFISEHILGMPSDEFSEFSHPDDITRWLSRYNTIATTVTRKILANDWVSQGSSDCPCTPLPPIQLAAIAKKLASSEADRFIQQPHLNNKGYETGVFARQWHHPLIDSLRKQVGTGLLSRWLAKLIELAGITKKIKWLLNDGDDAPIPTQSTHDGCGLSSIEAARGRLIHLASIHEDRITAYRILAPTEWNFHPEGTVYRCLNAIKSKSIEERKKIADFLIHIIDPCVTYRLEVT